MINENFIFVMDNIDKLDYNTTGESLKSIFPQLWSRVEFYDLKVDPIKTYNNHFIVL